MKRDDARQRGRGRVLVGACWVLVLVLLAAAIWLLLGLVGLVRSCYPFSLFVSSS